MPATADDKTPEGSPSPRKISIIVPTFREVESLPALIDRFTMLRATSGLDLEVWFMDDDSRDGSEALVAARGEDWVHFVLRPEDRGLSQAVVDGMNRATGSIVICMDADLSHPPEVIPQMLAELDAGADFVLGSRYIHGGTTADDWGPLRWVNSRIATLLARPFTSVRDPMSGYFALRRGTFNTAQELSPIGYKIGLELIVKCRCRKVVEIPIHFSDREFGESKLTITQQLLYIRHLRRLAMFKYGSWSHLMQFLAVGALGTVVNLAALTALLETRLAEPAAVATAIFIAMCFNFVLNRRFSFSYARHGPWFPQFLSFLLACSLGAGLNLGITVVVLAEYPGTPTQLAALLGIAGGTAVNFLINRYLVFRATHIRVAKPPSTTAAPNRPPDG
ncbi:MAG: glycosyltransferase family 2 protein [Nannocystaceae bacterium]